MKRFYSDVAITGGPGGWGLSLDGRVLKTPGRNDLRVPMYPLIAHIATEWQAQGAEIIPESMPAMQLATTAIDHINTRRVEMEKPILAYLNTDLILYRAEEPPALAQRQREVWDPWVVWFAGKSGVTLYTTTGLAALTQPDAAHRWVADYVAGLDVWRFTVLQAVTALSGSLVLAIAFSMAEAEPDSVFTAAQVEELYRAALYDPDRYGPDPDTDKKHRAMRAELAALATMVGG